MEDAKLVSVSVLVQQRGQQRIQCKTQGLSEQIEQMSAHLISVRSNSDPCCH